MTIRDHYKAIKAMLEEQADLCISSIVTDQRDQRYGCLHLVYKKGGRILAEIFEDEYDIAVYYAGGHHE